MSNGSNQPIFVLPEGFERTFGKDAQRTNILAARAISDTVRTTLGPKGMDKMLVDSLGDVVVTNDGVTILEEMEIEHPAAKMMVEIAKTQEEEVGDGTTTSVVIAGQLLKKAEDLLDQNIHSSIIARGYRIAGEKAKKILEGLGKPVDISESDILEKVAMTAMTGKNAEMSKDKLAKIVVKAITQVTEEDNGGHVIDLDNIKVEKKTGGGIEDSELINGLLIDKEAVHSDMPKKVKGARILLLDTSLEVKEPETETKINISSPTQLQEFVEQEEKMIKDMIKKIKKTKANVIFCQKGIDDIAQYYLAKEGILALRRVKKSDMEKLAKATGGKTLNNLEEIEKTDIGHAGMVEQERIAGDEMTFIRECKNPKAVTILVRGGTGHVIDEVERAVKDSLGDLASVVKDKRVVAGGGAPEIELSRKLIKYAKTLKGREQLAVKAFSEALNIIPRTLAENGGLDPIDALVRLKAEHEKGNVWAGVDVFTGEPVDMWKEGVIEPLKVKIQAVQSASEVATMILRIDDVIAATKSSGKMPPQQPPGMGGGMRGGMGGMPGMM